MLLWADSAKVVAHAAEPLKDCGRTRVLAFLVALSASSSSGGKLAIREGVLLRGLMSKSGDARLRRFCCFACLVRALSALASSGLTNEAIQHSPQVVREITNLDTWSDERDD